MNSKPMVWKLLCGLVLAVILGGCGVIPTATPTAVPTVDTRPTFDAVFTQAAQTVVANLTLNAPTATPVTPTSTSTPVPTETPALPTETPTASATPTREFIPWTKTPTPTQPAYACAITDVSPGSGTNLKVDQDFDAKWSLKNTGINTWIAGNTDIRYVSGTKLHTGGDLKDLSGDVAPNGTTTVTIDMKAPSGDGTFTTSWGIYLEDGSVCTLSLTINVTK